jgi:hypothetical protein
MCQLHICKPAAKASTHRCQVRLFPHRPFLSTKLKLKLNGELRYLLAIDSEPSFHLRLTLGTATPLPLACGEDLHPSGLFLRLTEVSAAALLEEEYC